MFLVGSDLVHTFSRPVLWQDEDIKEILTKFGVIVIKRCGTEEFSHVHPLLKDPEISKGLLP